MVVVLLGCGNRLPGTTLARQYSRKCTERPVGAKNGADYQVSGRWWGALGFMEYRSSTPSGIS